MLLFCPCSIGVLYENYTALTGTSSIHVARCLSGEVAGSRRALRTPTQLEKAGLQRLLHAHDASSPRARCAGVAAAAAAARRGMAAAAGGELRHHPDARAARCTAPETPCCARTSKQPLTRPSHACFAIQKAQHCHAWLLRTFRSVTNTAARRPAAPSCGVV